jgi:four helix bundle protein
MNEFQNNLRVKMDCYVHYVYSLAKQFPKEEIYGCTSQLRRASLSIILNYIEGFARGRKAVKTNFWEISYGSLSESKYLIDFCSKEGYINAKDGEVAIKMAEEIGAMLYHLLKTG